MIISSVNIFHNYFSVSWQDEKLGFGRIRFSWDGIKVKIDSENMSKEFVKRVLCEMIECEEIQL